MQALAVALTGFERGEIGLGMRKRRGFGECRVEDWQVETFDLTQPNQLVSWLEGGAGTVVNGKNIANLLKSPLPEDKRSRFILDATFALDGSLLIRSSADKPNAPDMVHLTTRMDGKARPVMSGTSLAGALRARAARIAQMVGKPELADEIFGSRMESGSTEKNKENKSASRAVVREREILDGLNAVQNRVKIDRFTGGTYPGALFDEQPVFGKTGTRLNIQVEMRAPRVEHIGLWVLLLKDLWTGDLPLGGESSVGRGRLKGISAKLTFPDRSSLEILQHTDMKLNLSPDQRDSLQSYVDALNGGSAA
jgi:CRISPR/Cas system CSM-associated protein Csm3 (group 7 of RAMP superfamily)